MYAGQLDCYERCNVILEKFIDIEVSASQVYLVTDCYGKAAETEVNVSRSLEPVKKEEVLYVQADGSMIQTRDDGWKEVKKWAGCLQAAPALTPMETQAG